MVDHPRTLSAHCTCENCLPIYLASVDDDLNQELNALHALERRQAELEKELLTNTDLINC
jgi:hypothetical protein